MNRFKFFAIAMAFTMGLTMMAFAFSRLTTKTLAQNALAAASCCSDASCCKDGACKMDGSCCDGTNACQTRKQTSEKAKLAGIPIEDASQYSNNAQASATDKKDCCAGGGSACCGGGSCCKSKTKTTASL